MKCNICILVMLMLSSMIHAQENTPLACSDGLDNDGDGQIDCLDIDCSNLSNNGCLTCFEDGLSFADYVISFAPACLPDNTNINPDAALGVSNWNTVGAGQSVSLGEGGSLILGFNNNLIVNSSDNAPDIWVFEVGPQVEASEIELRPFNQSTIDILDIEGIIDSNNDGYYEFGIIAGATTAIDIDAFAIGYDFATLQFDAIKVTDIYQPCGGETPGADIDAICALSSIPVDCNGTLNGTAIVDECGECLDINDVNFNLCVDCNGTPNGTAIIDECGECLDINDVNFNLCIDCNGTLNGTAIVDECGE
ncbi:MAG: hypothetical protein ACPG5B_13095, partial [Chitinophagales bacterium]